MSRRWTVIGLGLFAVLAGAFAGPASPAYAHAQLVGTTPANGARLDSAPEQIVLRFSERVSPVRDGIRLLDATGAVRTAGPPRTDPAGREVTLPVPAGLGNGAYVVSWRVVSADSHPIHGAFTFGVGDVAVTPLPDAGAQVTADSGVTQAYWLFRWLGYAGLAGLAGGALFLFVCWPAGWAERRARRLLMAGWIAGVLSATGMLLIQGPYTTGRTLASVTDLGLLSGTFGTDFGRFTAARLILLAIAALLLAIVVRWRGSTPHPPWMVWCAAAAGVALPLTWIGTGHANADASPVAWLADAVHLGAMAAWFGGLAFLVAIVLSLVAQRPVHEVSRAVTRFSRIATVCVCLLVVTGTYQAWRGVGSVAALAGSGYGQLLVFKLATVGVLLWFGWMSRNVVQRHYLARLSNVAEVESEVAEPAMAGGPRRPVAAASRSARKAEKAEQAREFNARRQLRWSVWVEVVIGVVVLGITALLVATPPGARPAAALTAPPPASPSAPPEIVASELSLTGGGRVYLQLDPARVGPANLVLTVLDSASKAWDVPEVTAVLRLPDQGIGPLPVTLRKARPGDYLAEGLVIPMAGTWDLQVKVRTSDFDQITVEAKLPVY